MSPIKLACAVALLGLGACAMTPSPIASVDAGATAATDAEGALGDATAPSDGSPRLDGSAPGLRSEADDRLGGDAQTMCLDFEDNDGNGVLDCDEPICQSATVNPACCVGSVAEACCDAVGSIEVAAGEAGACGPTPCLAVDGEPLAALGGTVLAGEDLPTSTCGVRPAVGFAPVGAPGSQGLLALPQRINPAAEYVRIEGRIGAVGTAEAELAMAGFGLFPAQELGGTGRPLVAVVGSVTAGDIRVIVGDRVIHTEPLGDDCARSLFYAIVLSPSGDFRIERRPPDTTAWDATPLAAGRYDVRTDARVAMFGQQPNPPAEGPAAWVSDLRVEQRGCDRLAPTRPATPIVSAGGGQDVSGLAVFPRDDGGGYEALLTSGDQIHWLSVQSASGGLVSRSSGDPFADNIQPIWPGYARFRDVEVVRDREMHRVFLAAAAAGSDVFEIVETTYTPGASPSRPGTLGMTLTRVLSAADFAPMDAESPAAVSVDGPTAAVVNVGGAPRFVLAARVRYADGSSGIRVAPSLANAGGPSVFGRDARGVTTNGLVHANQSNDPDAFDRDEVADPQLVVIDGVARVHYAGRRGTRWSIGTIVASPDFSRFTPVSREPLLGPSGAGFDALGVSEPVLVRRAATDWLYFAGSDGARRSVGVARQGVVEGTLP